MDTLKSANTTHGRPRFAVHFIRKLPSAPPQTINVVSMCFDMYVCVCVFVSSILATVPLFKARRVLHFEVYLCRGALVPCNFLSN